MISFIIGLLLFGGFYDFSVSATAVCVVAEILLHYYKKKPVYQKKKNYIMWIPTVIMVWSVIVSFWALDPSENLLGILRGLVMLLWMYRCFFMEEKEKQRILECIPYLGAGMVALCLFALVHEGFSEHFWQARRLGGFFQYSNTCALFLFLGVVILVQQMKQKNAYLDETAGIFRKNIFERKNFFKIAVFAALILGVFLTGSRSVLLLLFVWGTYQALKVKKMRIPFVLITGFTLVAAYIYGMIVGDSQNVARIFTLFHSNSTILGRVLYDIDAISIAMDHPFGLGYMGYYYIQPAVQTGVYTTRFIHNDMLQLLVDYGFPALAAGVVYLVYQLMRGKQGANRKELLVLILLASLVDFHLQYLSIVMMAVLCLDLGERDKVKKQKELRENKFLFGATALVFIYFTVAFGAYYFENADLSLQLFPKYTEAQIYTMNNCQDKETAVWLADDILSRNGYVADAYHTKIYAAVMDGEYAKVTEYMNYSLAIKRYDVATYQNYDSLLNDMIKICDSTGDINEAERLKDYKNTLPKRLAALEAETHPIAFKLRDMPVFAW